VWGVRKKTKHQPEFVTLVRPWTGRDKKKRYSISAPSIHIGALVGVGSLETFHLPLCVWQEVITSRNKNMLITEHFHHPFFSF